MLAIATLHPKKYKVRAWNLPLRRCNTPCTSVGATPENTYWNTHPLIHLAVQERRKTPYRVCVRGYANRGLPSNPSTARAWSEAPASSSRLQDHVDDRDLVGIMNFTPDETELLLYAVNDLIVRRTLGNRPLPHGFGALRDRLTSCVDATKSCAAQPQSPFSVGELIDTAEAAAILNCSTSWVRSPRFRDQLAARDIGGRWLFPRQTVIELAERRAGQWK